MTFEQLLQELGKRVDDCYGELTWPIKGDTLCARIASAMVNAIPVDAAQQLVLREVCVKALGPLRLQYMADDAPVEGFRLLEKTIVAIDDSFNDEALAQR